MPFMLIYLKECLHIKYVASIRSELISNIRYYNSKIATLQYSFMLLWYLTAWQTKHDRKYLIKRWHQWPLIKCLLTLFFPCYDKHRDVCLPIKIFQLYDHS